MENIKNNWGWYLLLLVAILYFVFMKQINNWIRNLLKAGGSTGSYSEQMTCDSSFYVKLADGKNQNVWTTDEGNTTTPNVKYYKQDVAFTESGVNTTSEISTITKEEFEGLCSSKYNPPYGWYTAAAPIDIPRPLRNGRR